MFFTLLTVTDRAEGNNWVAYYTAAASTVLIAAAAVIFKVGDLFAYKMMIPIFMLPFLSHFLP